MEDFTHHGYWWLPNKKREKVAGTLTFSRLAGGLKLVLIGMFRQTSEASSPDQQPLPQIFTQFPVILGETADRTLITLEDSVIQQASSLTTLRPQIAYIGRHFDHANQATFDSITLGTSHLYDWAVPSSVHMGSLQNEDWRSFRIDQKLPEDLIADTSVGKISIEYGWNFSSDWLEGLKLRPGVVVSIEAQKSLTYEEWQRKFIMPLQRFLSLVTRESNDIIFLKGYSNSFTMKLHDGTVIPKSVHIIYNESFAAGRKARAAQLLFSLDKVRSELGPMLENWFKASNDLDDVCDLFFGVRGNQNLYTQIEFLFYAQALEVYHSRTSTLLSLPSKEFKSRLETILSSVPLELNGWVKEKLAFANQPTLAERLSDLVVTEENGHSLAEIITQLGYDIESFLKKVKDLRNHYTHFSNKKVVVSTLDLARIGQILDFLLEACLLKELGFPLEDCVNMVKNTREYKFRLLLKKK